MKNIHQDLYVGVIIILISIFLYTKTFELIEQAAGYPRILLYLFAAFGILIIISGIKKSLKIKRGEKLTYSGDEEPLTAKLLKSPFITLVIVIIYAFLLEYIGFFPSTILFMACFLAYMKVKDWKSYVFTIAGLNLFIYLVFVLQLNVQLPKGILFE